MMMILYGMTTEELLWLIFICTRELIECVHVYTYQLHGLEKKQVACVSVQRANIHSFKSIGVSEQECVKETDV